MTPMAASSPLMTLDGKNAASDPARASPRPIWIRPARTTDRRNASNDPSSAIWAATTAGVALFSDTLPPPNLEELAAEVSQPLFLIYAERGQGGEMLSAEYAEAAGPATQLWRTDSTHVGGYDADPDEYERRVTAFFDEALSTGR